MARKVLSSILRIVQSRLDAGRDKTFLADNIDDHSDPGGDTLTNDYEDYLS